MSESGFAKKFQRFLAFLMLIVGVMVFAIRLQHAGGYALPAGGNLLAGFLALLLGAYLIRAWLPESRFSTLLKGLAIAASPVVLFFALYATLAELEEVVVLRIE